MERLARITDAKSMAVDVAEGTDERFFRSIGFEPMDVEQADNGDWYVRGHIPEPTLEEKSEQARQKRDELLSAVEWRVTRYNTQVQLGVTPTESDITPVLEYMQALRDLPETEGWPENIVWPKEP